jgi:hypothetical protein
MLVGRAVAAGERAAGAASVGGTLVGESTAGELTTAVEVAAATPVGGIFAVGVVLQADTRATSIRTLANRDT